MWIKALADQLQVENSIVIGSQYLYGCIQSEQLSQIGAPLLDFIEQKLALKSGLSTLFYDALLIEGLQSFIVLSIPYFAKEVYQGRLCVLCPKSAKIEAIINQISINSQANS